jgi:hypothetical protein
MAPYFGGLPSRYLQQLLVPLLVDGAARAAEPVGHAHGLHRVVAVEFPAQVVAGDEAAQARVERADVVVLEVDLDEGLPVVVALVQLDPVERVAREVQVGAGAELGHVGRDTSSHAVRTALEQQAVPFGERIVVQVEARILLEMRRADQRARGARVARRIGPAVQRADDVAAGLAVELAAALQDEGLTVAAHVGNELHALGRVHQRAALVLLRQGVEVAGLGHGKPMAHIARALREQRLHFARIERLVEVRGNWKLARGLLQLKT